MIRAVTYAVMLAVFALIIGAHPVYIYSIAIFVVVVILSGDFKK